MDLQDLIVTYSTLQANLVRAMFAAATPQDLRYFRDLTPGVVLVGGQSWSYRRHGAGVAFTSSDGRIVNAHAGLAFFPAAVDAGRLLEYTESVGENLLGVAGENLDLDDTAMTHGALLVLALSGSLRMVWHEHRLLFIPKGTARLGAPTLAPRRSVAQVLDSLGRRTGSGSVPRARRALAAKDVIMLQSAELIPTSHLMVMIQNLRSEPTLPEVLTNEAESLEADISQSQLTQWRAIIVTKPPLHIGFFASVRDEGYASLDLTPSWSRTESEAGP